MDFVSVIIFLGLYYIRPQEWIGFVHGLKPVTVAMAFALLAMLLRNRGLTWRDIFKTPHDWMMLAYFLWIVGAAASSRETLGSVYSLFLFYLVTVQALSNTRRLGVYLYWWAGLILLVAALAVVSLYGYDPMGSYDLTQWQMKGRLALNTSIFNNSNALGHGIVPVVLMIYFLLFWKCPPFVKVLAVPVVALPLYCIYLTVSKGAFVSGFATLVAALMFGRPKVVQALVLAAAFTVGTTALYQLPRMEEMQYARKEGGIQGRLAAFEYGREMMSTYKRGIGYEEFRPAFRRAHGYGKASHSSYVQIGAELGYTGLFLYLGILYCCLRTLLTARTTSVTEERIRRTLFVLVCSYMVSSWMVDFAYRAAFFLTVAAVAAFHRLMFERRLQEQLELEEAAGKDTVTTSSEVLGDLRPAISGPGVLTAEIAITVPASPRLETQAATEALQPTGGLGWNRIGLADVGLITLLTYAVVKFWTYILYNL